MDNKKEKASLNKIEEAKLDDATLNEIMFHMLNAVIPAIQLARTELQKMGAELEETKAELKKTKTPDKFTIDEFCQGLCLLYKICDYMVALIRFINDIKRIMRVN